MNLLDLGIPYIKSLQVEQFGNAGREAEQRPAVNPQVPQLNHVMHLVRQLCETQPPYGDDSMELGPAQEIEILATILDALIDDPAYERTQLRQLSEGEDGGVSVAAVALNGEAACEWWHTGVMYVMDDLHEARLSDLRLQEPHEALVNSDELDATIGFHLFHLN